MKVTIIGSLRSYDSCCKESVTPKYNFALCLVFCNYYSMFVTLYKVGKVYFRFLGMNSFHVMAKNERFTAAGSRCHQNLKYQNLTLSFGRLCQKIAPKSVPYKQQEYFSSFKQSNQ